MIVDLEKQGRDMFVTESVAYINKGKDGLWTVRFATSGRFFKYNTSRLLYMTRPESVPLGKRGLYVGKRRIADAAEILRFTDGAHTFYRVTHANGYYECLAAANVYVTRTPIDMTGGTTLDYLRKLSDEIGLRVDDADGGNILARQYGMIDTGRDNVPLAQYVGDPTPLASHRLPRQVIYPFGLNASQKAAVEAALTRQVSIIQGPPGTGKTQTILNIVANLVMDGKTVLIVSNNNSAVENVAEKMRGEGLGFIVAMLGNTANKEHFIATQPPYPDMSLWPLDDLKLALRRVSEMLDAAAHGFEAQETKARLTAELASLRAEAKHMPDLESGEDDWLRRKPSADIIRLLNACRTAVESGKGIGLWAKLRLAISFGINVFPLLGEKLPSLIPRLERAFYSSRSNEIEKGLTTAADTLKSADMDKSVKDLRTISMWLLKDRLAKRFGGERKKFSIKDLKWRSEEFLTEYPVVLSTACSAKNCISKELVFDYVIMDEASQVDVATGALALSCANNAVIVGDDKQLPNVVTREMLMAVDAIRASFPVDDRYDAATRSFLQSCTEVFRDAPTTLLREHYRCHPKIIGFCNKRFYGGELVAMTTDTGDAKALSIVRTVKGNHARDHVNQREVDTIVQEVMPKYATDDSIGIITPYRDQAMAINAALGKDIASTVHKFQGRECDTIIMSMVDNAPTAFSDDANMMNVAISRAKKRLYVVTTGNDVPPDTNLGQLIDYVSYNNYEVSTGNIRSVFDILYGQYTAERLAYQSSHPAISEHMSENLVYNLLGVAISELKLTSVGVLCHYPLSLLIADDNRLDARERGFASSPLAHVDFLVYNTLTKVPLCAIEVDGWQFHKGNETQQERDAVKDFIMNKIGLRMHRMSTTDTVTAETVKELLCGSAPHAASRPICTEK